MPPQPMAWRPTAAVATPRGNGQARRFARRSPTSLNRTRGDGELGARVRCSLRSPEPFSAVWIRAGAVPACRQEASEIGNTGHGPLSRRRRGSTRTRRTPPRRSPRKGRAATRTNRSKLANANTVAIRSKPSERELCWLRSETHSCRQRCPGPRTREPVRTSRQAARWRPPPASSFRQGGSGNRRSPDVILSPAARGEARRRGARAGASG
jgi:hypothetical protein